METFLYKHNIIIIANSRWFLRLPTRFQRNIIISTGMANSRCLKKYK